MQNFGQIQTKECMSMISVKNLKKEYDQILAVNNVSFTVKKGEILGFLGPNGAGKSTTMKMITGFVSPTSGEIRVCDHLVDGESILSKKEIGYVPENAPLYGDLSVIQFLKYCGKLRGLNNQDLLEKVSYVIKSCSLQSVENQEIDTLSKGYKRRVSLAQALIHDPKVLIMDEPTDGLDPNQKQEIRAMIKNISKDKCIILSTHILEEVEALCDRVIIIASGEIKFDGALNELVNKSDRKKLDDVFCAITTNKKIEGVVL